MNWQSQPISAITQVVTKGTTPTTLGRPFTYEGVNFVKAEALNGDSGLEVAGFSRIDEETHELLGRSILHEDDVLVTIAGAQVGKCGFVKAEYLPANTNQAVGIVRVDKSKAVPRYVYYFFKRPSTFALCQSLGGQAAQPNVNLTVLKSIQVPLPALSVQQAIADILSAYDDLIENNRRRMALLESAAAQLYQEWFVRLRFPGHEHTRITNGVPEGWKRVPLFDVAAPTYGHPFQSPLFTEDAEGLPVVRIRDVLAGESRTFTVEEAPLDRRLQNGDMLIGMDGDFHMGLWAGGDAWLNQRVVRIRSKGEVDDYLLFNLLRQPIRALNETITGTTVVHLGAKELKQIMLLLPTHALLSQANDWFASLGNQQVTLKLQNRQLRAARDLLLPRLMNGEIAV